VAPRKTRWRKVSLSSRTHCARVSFAV
jgi:hypothetical protein